MNGDLILQAVIGAGGAVLGAIAGGSAIYYIEKLKLKNDENDRRRQIYSQLLGNRILLSQSYNSYYSCFIQLANDYSYCLLGTLLAKVKGKLVQDDINRYMNNSISCQEAKITKTKYENLQPEIAKNSSRMWETIGLIQVLFPDVPVKIDELINQIKEIDKKFADLEMKIKSDEKIKLNFVDEFEEKYSGAIVPQERDLNNWSKEKLKVIENWSDEKESNLKVLIDELEKPIDHLLDEMLKVLKDERSVPDVMGGHPIIF